MSVTPEERFAALVAEFAGHSGVEVPGSSAGRGFGARALKVGGSIFAMLSGAHLVVKLPRPRVAALIESGAGTAFDAGQGRTMKEWLAVITDDQETWRALAAESYVFVLRVATPANP